MSEDSDALKDAEEVYWQELAEQQAVEDQVRKDCNAEYEREHLGDPDLGTGIYNDQPDLVLTEEQEAAVNACVTFIQNAKGPQQKRLGGYAGTGKTTIMKEVIRRIGRKLDPAPCAFTGKAASVLRRKGVYNASTIHQRMYQPVPQADGKTIWMRRGSIDQDYWLVDEASMVSTDIYNDMRKFNLPMLFVGDPGQLEPVGENPELMRDPDITLTKIHRQAETNPILRLADMVRKGSGITLPIIPCPANLVLSRTPMWHKYWFEHEVADTQIICAFNSVRHKVNKDCRSRLGYAPQLLTVGDKVICLRNDYDYGVFNGQQFYVQKVRDENKDGTVIRADLVDDLGQNYRNIPMWKDVFGGKYEMKELEKDYRKFKDIDTCFFDYGYCVTCHKSQGSEWKKVIVLEQSYAAKMFDMNRWRYTAITRAAENLVYCI